MYSWQKSDRLNKEICATCKNAGRILGYSGRGKIRTMRLWCEYHKREVDENYICLRYKSEGGKKLR